MKPRQDDDQALRTKLREMAEGGDLRAIELYGRLKSEDWWSRPSTAREKTKPVSEHTASRLADMVAMLEKVDLPEEIQVAKALLVLAESATKEQLTAAGLKASDLDLQQAWIRAREEKLRTLEAEQASEVKLPRQLDTPTIRPTKVRRIAAEAPTPFTA